MVTKKVTAIEQKKTDKQIDKKIKAHKFVFYYLFNLLDIKEATERYAAYKYVMTSLPLVTYNATRKLFAHLHFLHTMSHANKMNAENLASVWAPTIMPTALVTIILIFFCVVLGIEKY